MTSMLRPTLRLHVPTMESKQVTPNANAETKATTTTTTTTTVGYTTPLTPTLLSPTSIRSTDAAMDGNNNITTITEVIGIHRGAIDHTTITTRPPTEVMTRVRTVLDSIGISVQPESTFRFRCIRPSANGSLAAVTLPDQDTPDTRAKTIYANDSTRDPAGEVRFSVELTRLAGLSDTYSLDIRRLKGNLRSYQFLYETIRDRTQLAAQQ